MAAYPVLTDWLTADEELSDGDKMRVFYRFQTAVNEQDEGRDIGELITVYRKDPGQRAFIDLICTWLTGWQLATIVTGVSGDGQIPTGFAQVNYSDIDRVERLFGQEEESARLTPKATEEEFEEINRQITERLERALAERDTARAKAILTEATQTIRAMVRGEKP